MLIGKSFISVISLGFSIRYISHSSHNRDHNFSSLHFIRTLKRVCVIFRGSVGLRDWLIDGLGLFKWNEPKIVQDFASRDVRLHGGFSSKYLFTKTFDLMLMSSFLYEKLNICPCRRYFIGYLFEKSRNAHKDTTKFEEMIAILKEIYAYKNDKLGRDYSDYELFITGHSLGGGLSQILAFTLAGLKDTELSFLPKDKPITTITYASPEAGNEKFRKEFTELEKDNKLRHIRVSNHGDIVPNVFKRALYKQTGLNIHLYDERDDRRTTVGHNMAVGFLPNPLEFVKMHGLGTYDSRLFSERNKNLLNRPFEELYEQFTGFRNIK